MDQPASFDPAKRCCTCQQVKPLTDFNRLTRSADGRQPSCRECNRAYHQANWDRHMAQIRRRKRERRADNQRRLMEYLSSRQCTDCGEDDPLVLEFDHVQEKRHGISTLVRGGYEWAYVLSEIERCELVCANCHRRRTMRRANDYRFRFVTDPETWAAWGSNPESTD